MAVIPPPTSPNRREAPARPVPESRPSPLPDRPRSLETVQIPIREAIEKPLVKVALPSPPPTLEVRPPLARVPPPAITRKLEALLAQDILPLYGALDSQTKIKFRAKGKEILKTIEKMVTSGRVVARRVFDLIRAWLVIIPGINKYFLEQEAKIKTDKIIALTREKK